jgi:hypothetical protein
MTASCDWHDPARFPDPATLHAETVCRTPPTMLHQDERRLLRWLVREHFTGAGGIVDLGCWLGGSTAALVTGLRENRRVPEQGRTVHTYDWFRWHPSYEKYGLDFTRAPGECFVEEVERYLAPWRSSVHLHVGDITSATWDGGPIEILFVDLMKDAASTRSVALTFFPDLIPNRSFVLHQDFKHYFTFWLHLLMYRLRQYFVPVLNLRSAPTVVFQPVERLTVEKIELAATFDTISGDEIDAAFDYSDGVVTQSDPGLREEVRKARARAKDVLLRNAQGPN